MSIDKDSRGFYRGRCLLPDCRCLNYSGGNEGMKCLRCAHPPARHQKLTEGVQLSVPYGGSWPVNHHHHHGPSSTTTGYSSGAGNTTGYHHEYQWSNSSSASAMPHTSTPVGPHQSHSYASAVGSPPTNSAGGNAATYTSNHHHTSHSRPSWSPPPPDRPPCKADGCTKPRHYERGVGVFDYCSPSCRDKHLLPQDKKKVRDDIERFTETLKAPKAEKTTSTEQGRDHHSSAVVVSSPSRDYKYTSQTPSVAEVRLIQTSTTKDPGIIISEQLCTVGQFKGYLVTGVKCGSLVYEKLEKGELCLLDVIVKMNGQSASVYGRPGVFEERLKSEKHAYLIVIRDDALPCPKSLLERAKISSTHIMALRNGGPSASDYGLTISSKTVKGVTMGTPAKECGLQFDDEIICYAIASKGGIEDPWVYLTSYNIARAARQRKSIILAIKRK